MPAPVYNMNPNAIPQQPPPSYQDQVPNPQDYGGEFEDAEELAKKPGRRTVTIAGRDMNRDLLVSKLFYLFFYSAFGALFPLIAIFFKQLGMNATQAGLLIGIRPFVEFLAAPFWSTFADKFRQGKGLLLIALVCMLVSTLALNVIPPTTIYCLYQDNNGTVYKEDAQIVSKTGISQGMKPIGRYFGTEDIPPGIAPLRLTEEVENYNPSKEGDLIHPPFSTRVYSASQVQEVCVLLLLIIVIGEFFSSPAVPIADGLTVHYLKEDPNELYAKQRMWGSVGWAVAMFIMGMMLQDAAPPEDEQVCRGLEAHEKNYSVCFTAFAVLMSCCFAVSAFFTFPSNEQSRPDEVAGQLMDVNNRRIDTARAQEARSEGPQEAVEQTAGPGWIAAIKTFGKPHHLTFLFIAYWLGVGVGIVFSFLFWHLQDIGGGPNLYGFASVINHISEVAAFFFAVDLINKIGHIKVLYMGLLANVLRFVYVAVIPNAWFVLPIELVQGLTHATCWSACSSYISLASPPEQKPVAQRMLSTLHHGIGRGTGAIFGGLIITYAGTRALFGIYAAFSLLLFVIFFLLNRIFKVAVDAGAGTTTQATLGDTHLAPHGVPTSTQYQGTGDAMNKPRTPVAPPTAPVHDPMQDAYDQYVRAGR